MEFLTKKFKQSAINIALVYLETSQAFQTLSIASRRLTLCEISINIKSNRMSMKHGSIFSKELVLIIFANIYWTQPWMEIFQYSFSLLFHAESKGSQAWAIVIFSCLGSPKYKESYLNIFLGKYWLFIALLSYPYCTFWAPSCVYLKQQCY